MNPLDPSLSQKPAAIAEIERRLNANPSLARQLDASGSGSRRSKIEAVLNFVKAKKAELAASKATTSAKLATARAQVAATAPAKVSVAAPKNILDVYNALKPGAAKLAFLNSNKVAIQTAAKLSTK